jgi:hypothetical protein
MESGGFAAISAYVEGTKYVTVTKRFVKKDSLVTEPKDVRAMQLLTIARTQKNPVIKKEILQNALEEKSIFGDLIEQELALLEPKTQEAVASEPFAGTYASNDVNVNVRDYPDSNNSKVVAQLQKDQVVSVVEKTKDLVAVGGMSGYWFKIAEPSGWVFSPFLTEKAQ